MHVGILSAESHRQEGFGVVFAIEVAFGWRQWGWADLLAPSKVPRLQVHRNKAAHFNLGIDVKNLRRYLHAKRLANNFKGRRKLLAPPQVALQADGFGGMPWATRLMRSRRPGTHVIKLFSKVMKFGTPHTPSALQKYCVLSMHELFTMAQLSTEPSEIKHAHSSAALCEIKILCAAARMNQRLEIDAWCRTLQFQTPLSQWCQSCHTCRKYPRILSGW